MNASKITAAEENADRKLKEAINGYGAAHAAMQAALNGMANTDTSVHQLAANVEGLTQLVCQLTNAQATPPEQVYYQPPQRQQQQQYRLNNNNSNNNNNNSGGGGGGWGSGGNNNNNNNSGGGGGGLPFARVKTVNSS